MPQKHLIETNVQRMTTATALANASIAREEWKAARRYCAASLPAYKAAYPLGSPLPGLQVPGQHHTFVTALALTPSELQMYMLGRLCWFLEDTAVAVTHLTAALQWYPPTPPGFALILNELPPYCVTMCFFLKKQAVKNAAPVQQAASTAASTHWRGDSRSTTRTSQEGQMKKLCKVV